MGLFYFIIFAQKLKMKYFFIGIAGSGMSALAQFMALKGHTIIGSDRIFNNAENSAKIKQKFDNLKILTFPQGQAILDKTYDYVVLSSAIEANVPEYQQAKDLKLNIIHRSDLLKTITEEYKTIAVAGTSGKSTTTAMIFKILQKAGQKPSLLNGAALKEIENEKLFGNAWVDDGQWLVIETDESDGTITKYHPFIGVILNIDKDHKEINELVDLFKIFSENSQHTIVNHNHALSKNLTKNFADDFGEGTQLQAYDILQTLESISFKVDKVSFNIPIIGLHNVENALAAIAVAKKIGLNLHICAEALKEFTGIERRMEIVGKIENTVVIDDFAHNPAKIKSAINTLKEISNKITILFQPHGFKPLDFMKNEFIDVLNETLNNNIEFYITEPYYSGGTITTQISSKYIVDKINKPNVHYLAKREEFFDKVKLTKEPNIIMIAGARDNSLKDFAKEVYMHIKKQGSI